LLFQETQWTDRDSKTEALQLSDYYHRSYNAQVFEIQQRIPWRI